MIYTSFRLAKEAGACADSYQKFAKHVGGITKYGETKPIPLTEVLEVLGIDDALWVICHCAKGGGEEQLVRQFSYDCAMRADVIGIYEKEYPNDTRVRDCFATIKLYLEGKITRKELDSAWATARAAARIVARDFAWDSAWAAARDIEREWQTAHLKELLLGDK